MNRWILLAIPLTLVGCKRRNELADLSSELDRDPNKIGNRTASRSDSNTKSGISAVKDANGKVVVGGEPSNPPAQSPSGTSQRGTNESPQETFSGSTSFGVGGSTANVRPVPPLQSFPTRSVPYGWQLDRIENPWLRERLKGKSFDEFGLEASVEITDEAVIAVNADGSRNDALEKSMINNLQRNKDLFFPTFHGQKSRLIVLRTPPQLDEFDSSSLDRSDRLSGSLQQRSNFGIDFSRLFNRTSSRKYQAIVVSAPPSHNFANIPALFSLTVFSEPVPLRNGQKFQVAGEMFEIVLVKKYTPDDSSFVSGSLFDKYFLTIVVKSVSNVDLELRALMNFDLPYKTEDKSRISVDSTGNLEFEKAGNDGVTGITTPLRIDRYQHKTRNDLSIFFANVNEQSIRSVSFRITLNFKGQLNSVPLGK